MKVVSVCMVLLCFSLAGCSNQKTVSKTTPSPNGKWIAEATGSDHGALASSVTVVNLHSLNEGWKSENNVLIVPGSYLVSTWWEGNDVLHIGCSECPYGDAELITVKKGPIQIRYEEKPR